MIVHDRSRPVMTAMKGHGHDRGYRDHVMTDDSPVMTRFTSKMLSQFVLGPSKKGFVLSSVLFERTTGLP